MTHSLPEVDFSKIRAINGSQQEGFEEFCCQLARRDEPKGGRFLRYRGAGGDGGVECVWRLPGGDEWGYQAKYIRKLDKVQLTKSVTQAIQQHPRLTKYTICLPIVLTGPTGRSGKSQQERFEGYVDEWKALAAKRGTEVEFQLLAASDLTERFLGIDQSGGRLRYWFDHDYLSREWFIDHLDDMRQSVGPRYTPDLTIEVPVSQMMEALGETAEWCTVVGRYLRTVDHAQTRWAKTQTEPDFNPKAKGSDFPTAVSKDAKTLGDKLAAVRDGIEALATDKAKDAVSPLAVAVRQAKTLALSCEERLAEALETEHGEGTADSVNFRQFQAEYEVSFPARHVDAAREVLKALNEIEEFCASGAARIVGGSAMLITGSAGAGKTFAIVDSALNRNERKLCSVIVLGERFVDAEPWEQIRRQLGLPSGWSRDQMLDALDASAQASGAPAIIFVDALNESHPRHLWRRYLPAMISQVRRRSWLRLCMSVRTTYVDEVLSDGLNLPQVEHSGFEGVQYGATGEFFKHYGLAAPAAALLQAEFANPLYLRLVCDALTASGERSFPPELLGISNVIRTLLEHANRRVAEHLGCDHRDRLVHRAIDALCAHIVATQGAIIAWDVANELLQTIKPSTSRGDSLLDALIHEGLLMETSVASAGADPSYAVQFSFERVQDVLVAQHLTKDISPGDIPAAFETGGALRFVVQDYGAVVRWKGLLEALAIVLPERFNMELVSVWPTSLPRALVARLILGGLPYRTTSSISKETAALVRDAAERRETWTAAIETLLAIGTRDTTGGADVLDALLRAQPLTKRDAMWAAFLHVTYGTDKGVESPRLLRRLDYLTPTTLA